MAENSLGDWVLKNRITEMIEFLDNNSIRDYSIDKITRNGNKISGIILYNNKLINLNYMEKNKSTRDYTNELSLTLSDIMGKNVYYDIVKGNIIIII